MLASSDPADHNSARTINDMLNHHIITAKWLLLPQYIKLTDVRALRRCHVNCMYFFWNFSSQYVISAFLGLQKHILGFGRKALSHQLVVYKSPLNVGVIQVNFSS